MQIGWLGVLPCIEKAAQHAAGIAAPMPLSQPKAADGSRYVRFGALTIKVQVPQDVGSLRQSQRRKEREKSREHLITAGQRHTKCTASPSAHARLPSRCTAVVRCRSALQSLLIHTRTTLSGQGAQKYEQPTTALAASLFQADTWASMWRQALALSSGGSTLPAPNTTQTPLAGADPLLLLAPAAELPLPLPASSPKPSLSWRAARLSHSSASSPSRGSPSRPCTGRLGQAASCGSARQGRLQAYTDTARALQTSA